MAALSPRARRAVTLMFLALAVVAATAVYYLRPAPAPKQASAQPSGVTVPVTTAGEVVFYDFVSFALGWAAEAVPQRDSPDWPFSIFKTVDGGKHWHRQLSGHSVVASIVAETFHFADAGHGFMVAGDPLELQRTADGGEHWIRRAIPTANEVWLEVADARDLWLLARDGFEPTDPTHLFASSDAGDTWTQRSDVPAGFFPIFRNGAEGWAGGSETGAPVVYTTKDGAQTWERRDLPAPPQTTPNPGTTVQLLPRSGVVASVLPTGPGSEIRSYTSFDGGRSWGAVTRPSVGPDAGSTAFQDATNWWSIQDGALYKTVDAGRSWSPTAVEPEGLRLLHVFDSRHAWAELGAGNTSGLAYTSDGGLLWIPTNVPVPD